MAIQKMYLVKIERVTNPDLWYSEIVGEKITCLDFGMKFGNLDCFTVIMPDPAKAPWGMAMFNIIKSDVTILPFKAPEVKHN